MKWNASVQYFFFSVLDFLTVLFFTGCTVVQKYHKNVPFVFKNNISLKADASNDEKITLKSKLYTQIDDSAKVNVRDKFLFSIILQLLLHSIL